MDEPDKLTAEVARLDARFERVKVALRKVLALFEKLEQRVSLLELNQSGVIPQDDDEDYEEDI